MPGRENRAKRRCAKRRRRINNPVSFHQNASFRLLRLHNFPGGAYGVAEARIDISQGGAGAELSRDCATFLKESPKLRETVARRDVKDVSQGSEISPKECGTHRNSVAQQNRSECATAVLFRRADARRLNREE